MGCCPGKEANSITIWLALVFAAFGETEALLGVGCRGQSLGGIMCCSLTAPHEALWGEQGKAVVKERQQEPQEGPPHPFLLGDAGQTLVPFHPHPHTMGASILPASRGSNVPSAHEVEHWCGK